MSEVSCGDVCEAILDRLHSLGFKISDDPDHTDVLEALDKVTFVKDEDMRIVNEVKEAYRELWQATENGTVSEQFFELREKARGIFW